MGHRSQEQEGDERRETVRVLCLVGGAPDQAAHLHLFLLAARIALPFLPMRLVFYQMYGLRLCEKSRVVDLQRSVMVKSQESGEAAGQVADQDREFRLGDNLAFLGETSDGLELQGQLVGFLDMREKSGHGVAVEQVLAGFRLPLGMYQVLPFLIDNARPLSALEVDSLQDDTAASLADPFLPEIAEGENKIGKELNRLSEDEEIEGESLPRLIGRLLAKLGLDDKRAGDVGEALHHPRILRRRRLEDDGVGADGMQRAEVAMRIFTAGADQIVEDAAEWPAEGGSFVRWEEERLYCPVDQTEARPFESIEGTSLLAPGVGACRQALTPHSHAVYFSPQYWKVYDR